MKCGALLFIAKINKLFSPIFLHLYLYLFVHALLILLSYFLYKILPIMPSNLWKMQPAVVVCLDCLGEETS